MGTNYFRAFTVLAAILAAVTVAAHAPADAQDVATDAFPGSTGDIALTSTQGTGGLNIFRLSADGARTTQLTTDPNNNLPTFSADGKKIAFTHQAAHYDVYWMDANGSNEKNLTNNPDSDDTEAAFFPGGHNKIVFRSDRSGNDDLYTMTVNDSGTVTNGPIQLTTDPASDIQPMVSPDGTKIAFASTRASSDPAHPQYDIYVMKAAPEGSSNLPVRLTKSTGNDVFPDWSPDGKKIAFQSDRSGNPDIYTMKPKPESSKNRPVDLTKDNPGDDGDPSWSPDGKKIAFESTRSGGSSRDIWRMDADGSNPVDLTNDAYIEANAAWQPVP